MPVALAQHIAAVGRYIRAVPQSQRQAATKSQLDALMKLSRRQSSRTADDWTAAVAALADLPMAEHQIATLTAAFNEAMESLMLQGGDAQRRDNQDWAKFWTKVPQWLVSAIMSMNATVGLDRLLGWLHELGLRLPTEHTLASIAAVYLVLFEDPADKSAAYKHVCYNHVRSIWKALDNRAPVETWHNTWSPEVAKVSDDQDIWAVDPVQMGRLIASIPLRSTNKRSQSNPVKLDLDGMNGGGSSQNGILSMAAGFQTGLQQMQQMQMLTLKVLQARIEHQGAGEDRRDLEDDLAELQGKKSFLALEKAPTVRFGRSSVSAGAAERAIGSAPMVRPRLPTRGASATFAGEATRVSEAPRDAAADEASETEAPRAAAADEASETEAPVEEEKTPEDTASAGVMVPYVKPDKRAKLSLAQVTQMLLDPKSCASATESTSKAGKAGKAGQAGQAGQAGKAGKAAKTVQKVVKTATEIPAAAGPQKVKKVQKVGKKPSPAEIADAAGDNVKKVALWKKYGCSKCRYHPGCSVSCWSYRGMVAP